MSFTGLSTALALGLSLPFSTLNTGESLPKPASVLPEASIFSPNVTSISFPAATPQLLAQAAKPARPKTIRVSVRSFIPDKTVDAVPLSPQENDDSTVTWTDEEMEVAREKVTEDDLEDADAKTEGAIRAFFVSDANSSNGLSTHIPKTGLAVKASIKPPSVLARRHLSLLAQVSLLLEMNIADFWDARRNRRSYSSAIDWSTNFCGIDGILELIPDDGPYFNFKAACARHDFGYANYKKLGRFNQKRKNYIDDIFDRDMRANCAVQRVRIRRSACNFMADIYINRVRDYNP